MQQDHQRREQPRHQADETIVMWKLTKAGAMLLADPIMVEHLEMLERREVKQHHDEQHLSPGSPDGLGRQDQRPRNTGKTASSFFHPSGPSEFGYLIQRKSLILRSKLASGAGRTPFHPVNPGSERESLPVRCRVVC